MSSPPGTAWLDWGRQDLRLVRRRQMRLQPPTTAIINVVVPAQWLGCRWQPMPWRPPGLSWPLFGSLAGKHAPGPPARTAGDSKAWFAQDNAVKRTFEPGLTVGAMPQRPSKWGPIVHYRVAARMQGRWQKGDIPVARIILAPFAGDPSTNSTLHQQRNRLTDVIAGLCRRPWLTSLVLTAAKPG